MDRLSQRQRRFLMIVCIGVAIVVANSVLRNVTLRAHGIAGKGTVVSKSERGVNPTAHILFVQIEDPVRGKTVAEEEVSKAEWASVAEGSRIDIFYDPNNPSNFVLGSS